MTTIERIRQYLYEKGLTLMDNKKEFISNLKSELIEYANKL